MIVIRLIPVFLSALLIAAHLMRMGSMPLVILSLAFPFFLLIKKPWAAKLVQVCLLLATLEWIRTLVQLVSQRIESQTPWTRLAIILAIVTIWTAASACIFFTKTIKARYNKPNDIQKKS